MNAPNSRIRLLLVDNSEMMRLGITTSLVGAEVQVVAESDSARSIEALIGQFRPDVNLVSVRSVDDEGAQALTRISRMIPNPPMLMLASAYASRDEAQAKALGAVGCLSKRCNRYDLLSALRTAASGKTVWTDEQLRRIDDPPANRQIRVDDHVPLTRRQSEVLRHLALGLTTKQIAEALNIRYDTAKDHVQNTIRKIGVSSRTQAAVWAVRKGLA